MTSADLLGYGDVKSLKEKIDDIYEIVDRAHPRTP